MKLTEQEQIVLAKAMKKSLLCKDLRTDIHSLRVILPAGELTRKEKMYIYNKYIKDETQ